MKKYLLAFVAFLSIFLFFSCSQSSEEIVEQTSKTDQSILPDAGNMDIVAQEDSEIEIENYVAYVEEISGDVVTVNDQGNIRLEEGSLLGVGERILTLKNASLTLVFEDDSVIRLGENSSFTIETHEADETKTILNKGSLWGRILRPVGSENDFKVVASDVSATVRGTSIFVEIDEETKLTQLSVIDSYSDQGVVVTKDDEEIVLKPEEQVSFSKEKKLEKKKIQIQKLLKERAFVRENTKRDIVHMKRIVEKRELSGNKDEKTLEKIQKEIKNTLPKDEEVESFFSNNELKQSISGSSDSSINNIEDNIVGLILKDEIITSVKKEAGNKKIEETIKEIISDDFSSTKTQEVIEKATRKVEKLEIKQASKILKKANEKQVDVAKKIKEQEEIEKQERAEELKKRQERKEQEEFKKQKELERQNEIKEQKKEARLKKEAADNQAFEEARKIEREKKKEEEKQFALAESKKQQILRENEKNQKLKEKQEEDRLKKQELLTKQEQEQKDKSTKKIQEVSSVNKIDDTKVLGDISKVLDQGVSDKVEDKQESDAQKQAQLLNEQKEKELKDYRTEKKILYSDIDALKGQKKELLSEIEGIKTSLKFSEIGKVLEQDKKFAKEILSFIGTVEKKLSSSYDPKKLENSVSEISSGESLDFFQKQSVLVAGYYQDVYSDFSKIRSKIKNKRKDIEKRESDKLDSIEDAKQADDISTEIKQEIKEPKIEVVENIKITDNNTGVKDTVVKNTLFEEPKLNLKAQIQDNKNVKLSWYQFDQEENDRFKHYKIVRSSTNTKPVYPEDTSIGVKDTLSTQYHTDSNLSAGNYYYRVCVVTEHENRYCSNVEKVEIKKVEQEVKDEFEGIKEIEKIEEVEEKEEIGVAVEKPVNQQITDTLFTDTNILFKAKMHEYNNYVALSWSKFDVDEKFKYYKVVKSSTNSKPVYPEDQTIKIGMSIDDISYKDYDSSNGVNYYRVCVVTELNNRYCSNVVAIENNIAQKVEKKKDEFFGMNTSLAKSRDELLTKRERIEGKLNFSSLENVNQNDNYFVEDYSKKLTHVKNNLAEYNFDTIEKQISEISKISQFDDFHAKFESIETNLGKINNNLDTIEDEIITKREEIKSRQNSSLGTSGTIDVINSTNVK